jgi:hypothetical protein
VIKRDIEFNYLANKEIEIVKTAKRPLNNFYELPKSSDGFVENELDKALKSPTTEEDTHPSPTDRFRYIAGINIHHLENDATLVTGLFVDWNAITREMTQLIASEVINEA